MAMSFILWGSVEPARTPNWFHSQGREVQAEFVQPLVQAYSTLNRTAATWLQVEPSLKCVMTMLCRICLLLTWVNTY